MSLSAVKKTKPAPWPDGGASSSSFGNWLRSQREARGVELAEIAEQSKVSLRYLEAFEEERFDVLPAPVFAKGFLREYARFVGLDADEVVNHFLSASHEESSEVEESEEHEPPRRPSGSWGTGLLMALSVVVVIVLVAMLAFHSERQRSDGGAAGETTAASEATAPGRAAGEPSGAAAPSRGSADFEAAAAASEPAAAEGPQAPLRVTLDFNENCWVEIVIDGRRRIQEEQVQGASLQLEAESYVEMTLGNSRGVDIQVNGYPYRLDRASGPVVRGIRIDLETVESLSRTS